MHVTRVDPAHEERELGETHQVEIGLDVAVEVAGKGRQRADEIHAGDAVLDGEQQLLLPDRSAEIAQQVPMAGTDVLQRLPAVEMLRTRRELQAPAAAAAV